MRKAVMHLSCVALETTTLGLGLMWVGRGASRGACLDLCVNSLLGTVGFLVAVFGGGPLALIAAVTATVTAVRGRDWLALVLLAGGVLASASGAVYILYARHHGDGSAVSPTRGALLIPVAVLGPLVLVPLLTLLYAALAKHRATQRAVMSALVLVMLGLAAAVPALRGQLP